MVQLAKPISNGMIQTVSGSCDSCDHRFEWLLIRGKALIQEPNTAYGRSN
jgi:hypothetical protein